ncbi:MAG: AraC family transcriptional regulator, partial [Prevotellaceae bacterium]|nr:AraC family transcriptional regulator [Prevotellaceae bacterium]
SKSGNPIKAKEYFELAKKTPSKDKANWEYYILYNHARVLMAEKKHFEAISYHEKALDYALKNNMKSEYALFQYCEIGNIYQMLGDYDKAIYYGLKCIEPAKKINERDLLTSVYKMLGESYSMLGDSIEANKYNNQYYKLQDSLFNRMNLYSAGNELMEYENRRTNEQIDSLVGTINKQFVAITIISLLLIVLAILSFLLTKSNRRLHSTQRLLIKKNRELMDSESHSKSLLEQWVEKDQREDIEANNIVMSKEQTNRLLNKILEVMSDINVIANPDFSLNMLADAVGSNTKYVSWVINDTYHKNFKTFLNEYRIREACKRLSDTEHYGNITIQAIYYEVGYKNAVSFIRAFKKVNGMTPSEYQKLSGE